MAEPRDSSDGGANSEPAKDAGDDLQCLNRSETMTAEQFDREQELDPGWIAVHLPSSSNLYQ